MNKVMSTTNLQTRKLHLIEYLASTQDEQLLSRIELILDEIRTGFTTKKLTKKDLEDRAFKSLEDIHLGRVYTQQELETISQLW
jgi:hypothetical protein